MVEHLLEIVAGLERVNPAVGLADLVFQKSYLIFQAAFHEVRGHPLQQGPMNEPGQCHQTNTGRKQQNQKYPPD